MSLRERTQLGLVNVTAIAVEDSPSFSEFGQDEQPVQGGVGAEAAPGFASQGEAFRGVYIPLVENGEAMTVSWFEANSDPVGTVKRLVKSKSDDGRNEFTAAIGEGINGGDALRISCEKFVLTPNVSDNSFTCSGNYGTFYAANNFYLHSTGTLPGGIDVGTSPSDGQASNQFGGNDIIDKVDNKFRLKDVTLTDNGTGELSARSMMGWWSIARLKTSASNSQDLNGDLREYLGPREGRPYNTCEILFKVPADYRRFYQDVRSYNHNIGTYHTFDGADEHESYGYHFYFQTNLFWYQAAGGWFVFRVTDMPHNIRSGNGPQPPNPTPQVGNFWDSETRIYFTDHNYYNNESGDYPLEILADRFRIFYREPPHKISMTWDDIDNTSKLDVPNDGNPHDYNVTITNSGTSSVTGRIYCHKSGNGLGKYSLSVHDRQGSDSLHDTELMIGAGSSWLGLMRINLNNESVSSAPTGIVFIPNDQLNQPYGQDQRNFSNPAVYNERMPKYGPHDAFGYSAPLEIARA